MAHTPAGAWAEYRQARAQVIVVTGEIGAGKTTWCHDLIAYVREAGFRVAGLLSTGVFADGKKVAIELLDLAGTEQYRLADRLALPDTFTPTPNWGFQAETLAWGDTVLRRLMPAIYL